MAAKDITNSPQADAEATEKRSEELVQAPSQPSDLDSAAVIDYKTLTWWQGGIVLIAETVSLGILSLPSAMATLGLVPGIIMILVMSALTTYSGLMLGEFHRRYPFVQNFGDALEVIGKPIGMGRLFQEIFGWAQVTFQVFVMASHLLTWTICLNTLTNSSTCTIIWAVVGLGVFWVLNLPRTLKYTSWTSLASCLSITLATLMTVGDVGVHRPIGSGSIEAFRTLGFSGAFLAVTNVAIAFASHSCFFSIIGEFKKPEDFPKAIALLQVVDTTLYLIAAVVIYIFVGADVPSPALSASNSISMRKAIWGVAIPTIVIAGVVYAHVAAKYIFVRVFRNSKHQDRRTVLSTAAWFGITFGLWAISMIIAESIPVFNSLLGLVASLFVSWFSYALPGTFWLWMNYGSWFATKRQMAHCFANVFLLITGALLCVVGLWSSIEALAQDEMTKPWTCASNAA
ncbi:aromatic and neutral aliphatic amino acid permease [Stachybotrys elegans]|uniref:Aromatic and neutral aliphatic amino acid permease n=1 Tax=Stachybotrys elegans TaxID=80388 RepID=A0A8K0WKY3_9HYPO|nr:aromatic and neutral aliphatic amino acid permease [Stachybotrys elegans]